MQNQQLKFVDVLKAPAFREWNPFTGGILRTEDGAEFRINRNLLAERSPYFKALFFGGFADGTDVTLREISAETLDVILVYLYNKVASLTEENALDLLFASDYFLIDPLRKRSKSFLLSKISIDYCFSLFQIAWYIQRFGMFDDCRRFFACNFEEVISCSKEIGNMPFEALKSVLSDENLNVSEERTVWNIIVRWVNHDKPGRLCFVPELLKYIRFKDVDSRLTDDIVSNDIVKENSFCRELIFGKRKNTSSTRNFRQILNSQSLMKASRIPTDLHLIVQSCLPDRSNIYLTCDCEMDYWRRVGTINFLPYYLFQLDRYVYMFDYYGHASLIFDVVDEKCLPMPPLPEERFGYEMVAVNRSIYAFGSDIRRYFVFYPCLRKWNSFCYDYRKLIIAAAAMNGRIYVIEKSLYSFRVYDPASKRWSFLRQPINCGEGFLFPFRGHMLYICEGTSESAYGTVKEYDPLSKIWSMMPGLPVVYKFPQFVVFKNVLMVYERRNDELSTLPVYWDLDNRRWHIIDESSPLRMIHNYRFCTITEPYVIKEILKANRRQCTRWVKSSLV